MKFLEDEYVTIYNDQYKLNVQNTCVKVFDVFYIKVFKPNQM